MWEANPVNAIRHVERKRLAIKRLIGVFENKKHSRGGGRRREANFRGPVGDGDERAWIYEQIPTRRYVQHLAGAHFLRFSLLRGEASGDRNVCELKSLQDLRSSNVP